MLDSGSGSTAAHHDEIFSSSGLVDFDFTPPRRRVLIHVKDHGLRRIVAAVLRLDGLDAVEACEREDMLFHANRFRDDEKFEVVICDARREGPKTLSSIGALRRVHPTVPVVLLVVRCDQSFADEAARLGAYLLRLPMTSQELRDAARLGAFGH